MTGVRLVGVLLGLGGVALWQGSIRRVARGSRNARRRRSGPVLRARNPLRATADKREQPALAAGSLVWAALALLPFALVTLPPDVPSTKTLAAVVALGVGCTAASHALYYAMVSWHGASRSVLLTYVTPVFALLLGAWFLGEQTTLPKLAGLALIVAGVALGAGVGMASRNARLAQGA